MRSFVLFLLIVFSIKSAHSQELIELTILEINSQKDRIYLAERCAGVSLIMLIELKDQDDIELNKNLNDKYDIFSRMAVMDKVEILKRNNENVTESKLNAISREITDLADIYKNEIRKHYIKTGKSFPDIIMNDTKFCSLLYRKIKEM